MVGERQIWESKYEMDTGKQSQEITKLKFKLIAEMIRRAELRAENRSIRNVFLAMEQSLIEHKGYIVELQKDSIRHTMQYKRTLADLWEDKEVWKAQCLARQLYIKHTIKQIYKAIRKAHEILEKSEALHQSFFSTGRNGQQLLNFIEEVRNHCEQVKAFHGYNCNRINNV